jgi:hypothetical protein
MHDSLLVLVCGIENYGPHYIISFHLCYHSAMVKESRT